MNKPTIAVAVVITGPDESLAALAERGVGVLAHSVEIEDGQLTAVFETPAVDFLEALEWAQDRIDVGLVEELGCELKGIELTAMARFYP